MQMDAINDLVDHVMVHVDGDVDCDIIVAAEEQSSSVAAAARSTTLAAIRNKSAASARQELFESSVDCRDDTPPCCIAGLV